MTTQENKEITKICDDAANFVKALSSLTKQERHALLSNLKKEFPDRFTKGT